MKGNKQMEETQTEVTPEQSVETTDTSVQEPAQSDTSSDTEPATIGSEATNEDGSEGTEQEAPEWLNKSKYKTVEEQAKAYSELESKATKDSIKLAELEKRVQELTGPKEPRIIDENGNISKEFREQHQLEIDNNEFLTYEAMTRNIPDIQVRQEVENILKEAQSYYHFDKNAYSQTMDTLKQYFSPRVIEQIAREKIQAEQGLESKYKSEFERDRIEKANKLAQEIESSKELFQLVDSKSEEYSPEVFGIVKQLFDKYGSLDVDMTNKAISSIKALGVKEYLASQKMEEIKQSAIVPTGKNVKEAKEVLPTASELKENPGLYTKAVKKYGMETIDKIIVKG